MKHTKRFLWSKRHIQRAIRNDRYRARFAAQVRLHGLLAAFNVKPQVVNVTPEQFSELKLLCERDHAHDAIKYLMESGIKVQPFGAVQLRVISPVVLSPDHDAPATQLPAEDPVSD